MIIIITRSTGTMHTSTKARPTSVAIQIQICDLDRHQNLVIVQGRLVSKTRQRSTFPENFIHIQFLHKVANKQANRHTG